MTYKKEERVLEVIRELSPTTIRYFMPYAKSTIIERAFCFIDGLKPVQRRALYIMFTKKLLGKDKSRSKSQAIVGRTMEIHPHGDSSIYEAIINMSNAHEGMLAPYVDGKGNFGKVYNKTHYAHQRYTEVKLTDICECLFDEINDDAVDFVPTFDEKENEPVLLPSKFPNILVNSTAGIAVGMSANIPSFALRNVCNATIAVLEGRVKSFADLADLLGVPEFPIGGRIHTSHEMLTKLCETGEGKFKLSATMIPYKDKIVITDIPYNSKAEDIIQEATEAYKDGRLKDISEIKDNTGRQGFLMTVKLRRGADPRDVMRKLYRYTSLRNSISFKTSVIIGNRCRDQMSLLDVIEEWIKFRMEVIRRVYSFRLKNKQHDLNVAMLWPKIIDDIPRVINIIAKNGEDEAKEIIKKEYGLTDEQIEYILDLRLRQITRQRAEKAIQNLEQLKSEVKYIESLVKDDNEKKKLIIKELREIADKYGTDAKTVQEEPLTDADEAEVQAPVNDDLVTVVLTKSGCIKRLLTLRDITNFEVAPGDKEVRRWTVKNNEYMLVFTYDAAVYKVLVDDIDASRGYPKESLSAKLGISSKDNILWVDKADDYSGHFNVIYPNGKGDRVNYSRASGKRAKYIGLFEPCQPKGCLLTLADKFFLVTKRNKAAYVDLSFYEGSNRTRFKIARISSGDGIRGVKTYDSVPFIHKIDLGKYTKGYTVSIGNDEVFGLTLDYYPEQKDDNKKPELTQLELGNEQQQQQ